MDSNSHSKATAAGSSFGSRAKRTVRRGVVHLVVDGPDDGGLGVGGETSAGPDGHLLDAARDPGVAVHDVAVGVLPEPETELQAPVLGRRHGADLLGPRRIARGHDGEGVGDLVGEAFVAGDEGSDGVRHRPLQYVPASIRSTVARCMIMSSGSSGISISPKRTERCATLDMTMACRSAA